MNKQAIKEIIRDIPDFPHDGIVFKDITPLLKNSEAVNEVLKMLTNLYCDKGITKVIGIESRGFIFGMLLAQALGVGFVPIRKKGKLPAETYQKSYGLEYGKDTIEIHVDALEEDDIVVIHDDVLATGGTAQAAIDLIHECGVKDCHLNFILEISQLNGRNLLTASSIESLFTY